MSLAPPIEITPYDPSRRPVQARFKTQLCKNYAERGECSYGSRCSFYHPPPPTPTTASTLDLDPFNPTNDDPISPIYPPRKSSVVRPIKGRWPSSPLSFGQDPAVRPAHAAHYQPPQNQQHQPHAQLGGSSYRQWREQREFQGGDFEVYVVGDRSGFDGRRSSSYRTVPCKNYLSGFCPRGDHCSFKHEDPQPSSPSHIELDFSNLSLGQSALHAPLAPTPTTKRYKTVPCKFHLPPSRPCPKGEACTFLHLDEGPPAAATGVKEVIGRQGERILINGLSTPAMPPPLAAGACKRKERSSKPSLHPLYKTRQCKYWAADGSGSCTKGDACAFLHGSEPASSSSGSSHAGGAVDGGREEGKHPLWRTEPCLYFQKGTCTRAEQCNFLHVLAPSLLPTAAPTVPGATAVRPLGRKACLYLLRSGTCRFGDNCRYRHELLPVDIAAFAAAEQQAAVDAARAAAIAEGAVMSGSDDYDDEEGDIEIVLADPDSPIRPGALGSPPLAPTPPMTPGKRRTMSMSEVQSPAGQGR